MKKIMLLTLFSLHLSNIIHYNLKAIISFDEGNKTNLYFSKTAPFILNRCKSIVKGLDKIFARPCFAVQGVYTGVTGYTFFSPNPPDPLKLYFIARLGDSEYISEIRMNTFEGHVRKNSICSEISFDKEEEDPLKSLKIRSISARFFELHPHIKKANLCVIQQIIPTIEEYIKNRKIKTNTVLNYEISTK